MHLNNLLSDSIDCFDVGQRTMRVDCKKRTLDAEIGLIENRVRKRVEQFGIEVYDHVTIASKHQCRSNVWSTMCNDKFCRYSYLSSDIRLPFDNARKEISVLVAKREFVLECIQLVQERTRTAKVTFSNQYDKKGNDLDICYRNQLKFPSIRLHEEQDKELKDQWTYESSNESDSRDGEISSDSSTEAQQQGTNNSNNNNDNSRSSNIFLKLKKMAMESFISELILLKRYNTELQQINNYITSKKEQFGIDMYAVLKFVERRNNISNIQWTNRDSKIIECYENTKNDIQQILTKKEMKKEAIRNLYRCEV